MKLVNRLGLIFYTTLKTNRLVSLSKESGYVHLDEIEWTEKQLENGIIVKLKKVPFKVKLFKGVATNGDIDWVITNDLNETVTTQVAQEANDLRGQIEDFHRELKQLTGSAKCQCRKARSQRNHLACCYHAWISLKAQANLLNTTVYRVRKTCSVITCGLNSAALLSRLFSLVSESPTYNQDCPHSPTSGLPGKERRGLRNPFERSPETHPIVLGLFLPLFSLHSKSPRPSWL